MIPSHSCAQSGARHRQALSNSEGAFVIGGPLPANIAFSTMNLVPDVAGFAPTLSGGVSGGIAKEFAVPGLGGGGLLGAGLLRRVGPLAVASAAAWAIGKTVAFVGSAVSAASDMEQSTGAVETVFKSSSAQVLAASRSAASSLGIAGSEYQALATLLGTQLRNGGTATDALAGQTEKLITLGGDLSALFGGTTADSVDALSSALKGERDPIERYGVSLNQASIDAKAAELGFQKVGGSLSQQANQAATLALIMDQTADAHGAFGRETDTLASKQQRLDAMWANATAGIGAAFLPAASGFASVMLAASGPAIAGAVHLATAASDAITALTDGDPGTLPAFVPPAVVDALAPIVSAVFDTVGEVASAFAPAIPQITSALGELVPALASVLPSLSPVGLLLAGLLPVLPQLLPMVLSLAEALGSGFVTVHALFVPLVAALGALMRGQFLAILPYLVQTIGVVVGLFASTRPAFLGFLAAALPLVAALVADVLPGLVQVVGALTSVLTVIAQRVAALAPFVAVFLAVLVPAVSALTPVVQAAASLVISVVTAALEIVRGVLEVATGILSGNWAQVWSGIGTILRGVWSLVTALVSGAIGVVVAAIRAGVSNVGRLFGAAWDGAARLLGAMTDGLRGAVEDGLGAVLDFLGSLGSTVRGAVSGAGSWLADVGRFIVEGFVDGVKAMTQRIADAVLAPIRGSVDAVKGWLGIHSPSAVMRDHAESAVDDALQADPPWPSADEIGRKAPRSFVGSITEGLEQGSGGEHSFELPSTGSVKGDLAAIDFLLSSQRALEPV